MKISSSKAKGRALQQWVRNFLRLRYPLFEPEDIESRSMGSQGADIILSPAAQQLIPLSIECKNQEGLKKIYDFYDQALTNCKDDQFPVVIIKSNRQIPLAIIDASYFLRLGKSYGRFRPTE